MTTNTTLLITILLDAIAALRHPAAHRTRSRSLTTP